MAKVFLSESQKKYVASRSSGKCEYCKFPKDHASGHFHNDHIIPPMRGGGEDVENFAYACNGCDSSKGSVIEALDPQTNEKVRLFHPRKDDWNDHFEWSENYQEMIGNTDIGRATIFQLDLNRLGLKNFRKLAHLGGVHP